MATLQDITSPMSPTEKRATASLAGIYALRMLGLFLIMPVLSLFSEQLEGSTPTLIGWAIGAYGLSQAVFQIPFGLWSDKFGRKKIIVIGLLLFAAGSVVAALSTGIYGILTGRLIQGSGAVAGPIMALLADLTQEVHRTKAMAVIGSSIGLAFGVAVITGPVLSGYIGLHGLFWLIAALSIAAVGVIVGIVPNPAKSRKHRDAELLPAQFSTVFGNGELLRLDYGIFTLHTLLSASFVVVPLLLRDADLAPALHWRVYLPIFAASLIVMVPFIIVAEKKQRMKPVFLGAIGSLVLAEAGLAYRHDTLPELSGFLLLFFCGFNLLEATLPSLISKTAPADLRGTAMGVYSTAQFIGAGLGGAVGGWCYGRFGADGVFWLCASAAFLWLLISAPMKAPRHWANLLISLEQMLPDQAERITERMLAVPGVEEVTYHREDAVAYLKVDNRTLDKTKLQALLSK